MCNAFDKSTVEVLLAKESEYNDAITTLTAMQALANYHKNDLVQHAIELGMQALINEMRPIQRLLAGQSIHDLESAQVSH